MAVTLGQQYIAGERSTVILYCTHTLIAIPGHQTQQKYFQVNNGVWSVLDYVEDI